MKAAAWPLRRYRLDPGVQDCGAADSGVGPFYCPADSRVHIDLSFYNELAEHYGAGGEFAQPHILGHEYGHHVQNLLGDEEALRDQFESIGDNGLSVLVELQGRLHG